MRGKDSSKYTSITNKLIDDLIRNQHIPRINIPKIRRDVDVYLMRLRETLEQIEALREYLCPDCKLIFDAHYPVIKDEVNKYDFLINLIKTILTIGRAASLRG